MKFPNPETAHPDGLLTVGGELTTETLLSAYSQGIFPWPQEGLPLLWFYPPRRGVLFFERFKVPKTTQKVIKKQEFKITHNQSFSQVIEACARIPRKSETGTWILPEMIQAYQSLFEKGHAHSFEAWYDGELVGGLYGVLVNGLLSGESLFFRRSEASKVCLVHLVQWLKSLGHQWMDIQMVTPLLASFGGEEIERKEFLRLIKENPNGG